MILSFKETQKNIKNTYRGKQEKFRVQIAEKNTEITDLKECNSQLAEQVVTLKKQYTDLRKATA